MKIKELQEKYYVEKAIEHGGVNLYLKTGGGIIGKIAGDDMPKNRDEELKITLPPPIMDI